MTVVWVDTETTGLKPIDSGIIELAMLVYRDGKKLAEEVFLLNPLDDEVLFHEEAFEVNGISKETIETYPPASEAVPEIVKFLEQFLPEEKLVFAGFNCKFDYDHFGALLFRHGNGDSMDKFFNGKLIDVLEIVRKAQEKKILPKTDDQKLVTLTKSFGIPHDGAHGALSDIKATRQLYETIYAIERSKR